MIVLMGFVLGLPLVIVGVVVGLLAASVVAAVLVVARLRCARDYIPQGPFLAVGAIVALFFGYGIWSP